MSETSPLDWLRDALEQWDEQHLRRRLRVRSGPQQPTLTYGEKTFTNFGANDYLNLANDPRIAEAVRRAVDRQGWGSGAREPRRFFPPPMLQRLAWSLAAAKLLHLVFATAAACDRPRRDDPGVYGAAICACSAQLCCPRCR